MCLVFSVCFLISSSSGTGLGHSHCGEKNWEEIYFLLLCLCFSILTHTVPTLLAVNLSSWTQWWKTMIWATCGLLKKGRPVYELWPARDKKKQNKNNKNKTKKKRKANLLWQWDNAAVVVITARKCKSTFCYYLAMTIKHGFHSARCYVSAMLIKKYNLKISSRALFTFSRTCRTRIWLPLKPVILLYYLCLTGMTAVSWSTEQKYHWCGRNILNRL